MSYSYNNEMDQITDTIWLGNFEASRNTKNLKTEGITKVLSVMDYAPQVNVGMQKIVDVLDTPTTNIIQYFGECLQFIEGKEKVLVHCWSGASRSSTIVIAYVMWKWKLSADDAFNYVFLKRTGINPNPGFKQQLKIFEKLLRDNQYDINRIDFYFIDWNPKKRLNNFNKKIY